MKNLGKVWDLISKAHDELVELKPNNEEIQAFADLLEKENRCYGVVTYSKCDKPVRSWYFIRFHNTWKTKFGGRIHVDIGYVDEKYVNKWNVPDTTHLMLDKHVIYEFIEFVKSKRKKLRK